MKSCLLLGKSNNQAIIKWLDMTNSPKWMVLNSELLVLVSVSGYLKRMPINQNLLTGAQSLAWTAATPPNGAMMTKPYAAGGAYISRMSNYCKGCAYNPKLRVGESACPFTTLYWDFLDRHKETFAKNHRMSQQVFGLNRLSDLPELKIRAKEVLSGLEKGTI
jgi:hypothetical protein